MTPDEGLPCVFDTEHLTVAKATHEHVSRVARLYVDGRPLYKCDDCDTRFVYEDEQATCGIAPLQQKEKS